MKKYIKGFFKEIVPVIAGILIALWINNWNEDRKDRAYVNKVYSSIVKELKETDKEIDEKMKEQQRLIDTLNIYVNNDKLTLLETLIKANGLALATIRMNAWKTLSNSKIELLDYEKVSLLANVEEGRNILKMKTEYTMNFMYENLKVTSKDKKELTRFLVMEMMTTERGLKEEIKKVLND